MPRNPTAQILLHTESRNELASNKCNYWPFYLVYLLKKKLMIFLSATNENSFDIVMQYAEIKQRLNVIEDQLYKITDTIAQEKPSEDTGYLHNRRMPIAIVKKPSPPANNLSQFTEPNLTRHNLSHFFNLTNLIVAIVAWLVGLVSAVVSNKLLDLSSK